jgi:hypothetical protein
MVDNVFKQHKSLLGKYGANPGTVCARDLSMRFDRIPTIKYSIDPNRNRLATAEAMPFEANAPDGNVDERMNIPINLKHQRLPGVADMDAAVRQHLHGVSLRHFLAPKKEGDQRTGEASAGQGGRSFLPA